jgi:uncharacterized protein (TIGR02680 family)
VIPQLNLLPDSTRPSPEMRGRLDALQRPGRVRPRRWAPCRLILQNYWLFDYQEFHFADGRLVLRGANSSGKSTVLTSAITLVLDGNKRRELLDSFGSGARNIPYYLLGTNDATPESDFYHEERTGYIALEFEQGAPQRFCTIGMGLRARRTEGGGNPDVESWFFVIEDQRRIGIDFELHAGDPQKTPLTRIQLRDLLGNRNKSATRNTDYQDAVNRALFGFADTEQLRSLLRTIVQLRSPKLNKDTKPSDVCDILTESLRPLDEGLLGRVSQVIEDIDTCQDQIVTLTRNLKLVEELDRMLGDYLRDVAQRDAVRYRRAAAELIGLEKVLASLDEQIAQRTASLEAVEQELAELHRSEQRDTERRRTLQQHEAYAGQEELVVSEQVLIKVRVSCTQAGDALRETMERLKRDLNQAGVLAEEWTEEIRTRSEEASAWQDAAQHAAWDYAERCAGEIRAAFERPSPEGASVPLATLRELGRQRDEALQAAEETWREEQRAAEIHEKTKSESARLREALVRADGERQAAETKVDETEKAAVRAVADWRDGSPKWKLSESAFRQLTDAVLSRANSGDILDPVESEAKRLREQFRDYIGKAQGDLGPLESEKRRVGEELAVWQAKQWASPEPRRGQIEFREMLAQRGIPAVPLYAACDLQSASDPAAAAWETALEEAGLLDALIVPAAYHSTLRTLNAEGDRWFVPREDTVDERGTLGAVLAPVPCSVPPADIEAILRSIRLSEGGAERERAVSISPDRTWRHGLLRGRAAKTAENELRFLGEANRRSRREREIARLQAEAVALVEACARKEEEIRDYQERADGIEAEVLRLRKMPVWDAFQMALETASRAVKGLDLHRRAHEASLQQERDAFAALILARRELGATLALVDGAREAVGIPQLRLALRETVEKAGQIAAGLARLMRLRDRRQYLDEEIRRGGDQVATAKDLQHGQEQALIQAETRCQALRERLQGMGFADIEREVRELTLRLGTTGSRRDFLKEQRTEAKTNLGRDGQEYDQLSAQTDAARARQLKAIHSLDESLAAYPNLRPELDRSLASFDFATEAANQLLRFRRTERIDDLERLVLDSLERDKNALISAFQAHKADLVEFQPELDTEQMRVFLRHDGQASLPYVLAGKLRDFQKEQQSVMREKEAALYEDFFLNDVASTIRERIEQAEASTRLINTLLAAKTFSNGTVLSLSWKPVKQTAEMPVDHSEIVGLLRLDPAVLRADPTRKVSEFFRARVNAIRESEASASRVEEFGQALRGALDYRQWFRFALHSQKPGEPRRELTDRLFDAGSGGEKSLTMFIPLLFSAHASYAGARADAPKLVGIDEAFAGVDQRNTNEMLKLLVELDFSWIMTSEKLWGHNAVLPACTTYELVRRGGLVAAWLFLWNGVEQIKDPGSASPDVPPTD